MLMIAAAVIAAQPATSPAAALDAALAPLNGARPGCAGGIIQDGGLAHTAVAGLVNLETATPITAATPFNIASLSKQFTAAAAVLLIQEGKLSEEDDIRRYLPELRDYGAVIRVRDLIQHSSGLRNHMALAAFSPGSGLPSNAEALALVFRQSAINFAPGTRHQYESPGYVLLAEIVARIERKPFEQVLADRIFRPLGMTRTGFAVSGQARAYNAGPDGAFTLNEAVNTARGSSGVVTSVEDFAKWLAALSDGRFGRDFLARMTSGGRLKDGTTISYGYGLSIDRNSGEVTIAHGGQTAAYRSTFSYLPARRAGVILLCNVSNAPLGVAGPIMATLRPAAEEDEQEAPAQPLPAEKAAPFAGHYHDFATDNVRSFAVTDGALTLNYFGRAIPLTYVGDGRFTAGAAASFAFTPDGANVAIREPNQPSIPYARLHAPIAVPLDDLIGEYRSADVDEVLRLRIEGGQLIASLKGRDAPLRQIHPDGFVAPEADFVHVTFLRDAPGRVIGFTLTTSSGINRMRYDRAPG